MSTVEYLKRNVDLLRPLGGAMCAPYTSHEAKIACVVQAARSIALPVDIHAVGNMSGVWVFDPYTKVGLLGTRVEDSVEPEHNEPLDLPWSASVGGLYWQVANEADIKLYSEYVNSKSKPVH